MKSLKNDQAGIGHIILIVAFLALFAGIGAFAYSRVSESSDKKAASNTGSQVASQDDDTENAIDADKASLPTDDDQPDPSEAFQEGTN